MFCGFMTWCGSARQLKRSVRWTASACCNLAGVRLLPRLILLLACWLIAGQSDAADTNAAAPSLAASASLYTSMESLDAQQKLGIGDRVSYRVVEEREDPKALTVTDSGELEIPYLGRVKAVERTCKDLAREIKTGLEKELYYQATVILAVDLLNKKRGSVYLVGQLRAAGALDIPSDEVFTLSKAILKAGGFSDFADKKHVKLNRKAGPGAPGNKVLIVDVAEIFEKGKTDKDLKLEPGDLIFVPSRLINF